MCYMRTALPAHCLRCCWAPLAEGAAAAVHRHRVFFRAHWHDAFLACGLLCPHPVRPAATLLAKLASLAAPPDHRATPRVPLRKRTVTALTLKALQKANSADMWEACARLQAFRLADASLAMNFVCEMFFFWLIGMLRMSASTPWYGEVSVCKLKPGQHG